MVVVLLAAMMVLSLVVRLDDLTDLPLDFHPTRQLHSAMIARGMYYENLTSAPGWQRQMAVAQRKSEGYLEPPVLESLAVLGYRWMGKEALWMPRALSALFWVLGSLPLFFLARHLGGDAGGLTATAYYLFLPYGVIASRSFQPEALMVASMLLALWVFYRWSLHPNLGWALLAGGSMGLAVFTKAMIAFPLAGAAFGLLLGSFGLKRAVRNSQTWVIGILALLPYITYYLYGEYVAGYSAGSLGGRFFAEALITPSFYLRWGLKASSVITPIFLLLAPVGVFLLKSKVNRWFMIGLWVGYIIYGLIFNYQTSTHDYYHLPLVPIVALSLAPLALWLTRWAESFIPNPVTLRWIFMGALALAIGLSSWNVHRVLVQTDYRGAALLYEKIGQKIWRKSKAIALTEDYGNRLAYWGWINPRIWPSYGDLNYQRKVSGATSEFRKLFSSLSRGMDYFIVTRFDELDLQSELRDHLYQNFPVYDWGDGYVIFDLRNPLTEPVKQ